MPMILPRDVVRAHFMGSPFRNAQMESMLRCIVITQFKMDNDAWTPFTWEEYVAQCTHEPIETERRLLDAMVGGGQVWLNDMGRAKCITLEPGYLSKNNDRYTVTEKLLKIMHPYAMVV